MVVGMVEKLVGSKDKLMVDLMVDLRVGMMVLL